MVMVLFQVEKLKAFVLEAIRANDRSRIPLGTKKPFGKAFATLVEDGIITESESDEIQELIDYRNVIAHAVHELTADISRDPVAEDHSEFSTKSYDYSALRKAVRFQDLIAEQ